MSTVSPPGEGIAEALRWVGLGPVRDSIMSIDVPGPWMEKVEKETGMKSSVTPEAVLEAIERRVAGISAEQHALAVEKGRLLEHVTPLRLGVASAELVLVQLKTRGIRLAGLTGTGPTAPREEHGLTTALRTVAWPPERPQPAGRRASVSRLPAADAWFDEASKQGA